MDRALWLLLGLRLRGWLRRLRRGLGTVRGALLALFGLLVILLWVVPTLFMQPAGPPRLEQTRRVGPLLLVGFCVLNVLFSAGERAITFNPAEVNLLFPAPFSRRQLLLYKLVGNFGAALFSALILTLVARQHTASYLAGFVGLTLILLFCQLFSTALALVASIIGTQAFSRRRRFVLAALAGLVALAVLQAGTRAYEQGWVQFVSDLEDTPVLRVVLAPVNWLIRASTAEHLWPDLLQWAGLGLAVDAALLLVVLGLDAQYLEASAAASEKLYARIQRLRRGGPAVALPRSGRVRASLPSLPWWGGVGPLLWRQLTTAARSVWFLVLVLVYFGLVLAPTALEVGRRADEAAVATVAGILVGMALFVPPMLPFDFRGDFERLDVLKALPIRPWRVVLGQLLAPVLIVTLVQLLMLGGVQVLWRRAEPVLLAVAVFVPPINLLLFGLENLFFLWFPARLVNMAPGDFQMLGRHMVQWVAKLFVLALLGGVAFVAGAVAYFATGRSWLAGGLVAWTMLAAGAAGLVPVLALALTRFDVARDVPT